MAKPAKADEAASRILDARRVASPRTFHEVCAEHGATAEEIVELAFHLAERRYRQTLRACINNIGILRA